MEDFFYVSFDVFSNAFDEGVADAAFHRFIAPGVVFLCNGPRLSFEAFGKVDQAFGGIISPVQ